MVTDSKTRISILFARCAFLGILAALLALAAHGRARAQSRKIELGDLQKIVGVSSPAISPDGRSIVIIVSRVNWDEDRYDNQLVLVDIATLCAACAHQHPQRIELAAVFARRRSAGVPCGNWRRCEGREESSRASLRAAHERGRAAADHQRAQRSRAVCLAAERKGHRLRHQRRPAQLRVSQGIHFAGVDVLARYTIRIPPSIGAPIFKERTQLGPIEQPTLLC